MDPDPARNLADLINNTLTGAIDLQTAKNEARALGDAKSIEVEIWQLLKKLDRLQLQEGWSEYLSVAIELCEAAAHRTTDQKVKLAFAFLRGRVFLQFDDRTNARSCFATAEALGRQLGDRRQLAVILGSQASLLFLEQDFDNALKLYEEANGIAKQLEDTVCQAGNEFGIGLIKIKKGLADEAKIHLITALGIHRTVGNYLEEFKVLATLANLAESLELEDEQHDYLLQATAIANSAGLPPRDLIRPLGTLGMLQLRRGQKADAARTFEDALKAAQEDGDRFLEGYLAGNLGAAYCDLGRLEESRSLLELALRIAQEQNDEEGVRIARHNLRHLEQTVASARTPEKKDILEKSTEKSGRGGDAAADDLIKAINAAAERIAQAPHNSNAILDDFEAKAPKLDVNAASHVVRTILTRIDEVDESNPRLGYTLSVVISSWAPDDVEPILLVQAFQKLATYSWRSRQMDQAVVAFSRAAAVAQAAGLTDQFIASVTNLASTLRQAGRSMEALQAYEAAMDAFDSHTKAEVKAMVFLNAATAYADAGLHQQSKEVSESAVMLLADQPEHSDSLLIAYMNLGAGLYGLGEIDAAETAIIKALELSRRERVRSQEGVALGHLGLIRQRQGRFGEALPLLERASEIAESVNDRWNAQHWRADLANAYLWNRQPELAIEHFLKARDISRSVGDLRSEGKTLMGLGIGYLHSDLDRAPEYLLEAWDIQNETGNYELASQIAILLSQAYSGKAIGYKELVDSMLVGGRRGGRENTRQLARQIKDRDAFEQAELWLDRARELQQLTRPGVLDIGVETQVAQLLSLGGKSQSAAETLEKLFSAKLNKAEFEADLIRAHELYGNICLMDLAQPQLALVHITKAIDYYERVSTTISGNEDRVLYRNQFAPLYFRAVECAVTLGRTDTAFELCERSKISEMRRLWALAPNAHSPTALPSLARLTAQVKNGRLAIVEFLLSLDRTYVWVIAPGLSDGHRVLVLDQMNTIDASGDHWVKLQKAYEDLTSVRFFDPNRHQRWMDEVSKVEAQISSLLQPVFELIKDLDIEQVVFIPHQFLHCFPLHAARISETTTWLDRYEIFYAPSATVLVDQWETAPDAEVNFAGFADPEGDLPLARLEVQIASQMFPDAGHVYYGADASEERAIKALSECNWLHFACHASHVLFDSFASGIYLAGTDVDKARGFLSLYRINRDVRLASGTRVILSACETGTVTPLLTDEFISLAGGFIAAGAQCVVASYWKVKDACAALLLEKFYQEVHDNKHSFATALRTAQLWVRDLNEEEVYDNLERLLGSGVKIDTTDAQLLLAVYSKSRGDVYPFANTTDWAGFYLCGPGSNHSLGIRSRTAGSPNTM